MLARNLRWSLAAVGATAVLWTVPAESHAIFDWLNRLCSRQAYAPVSTVDPCNTCQPPQVTANYVPQTCYRTQYVNVPVTTYRPAVGTDPCTGCPVTCMRPTISYVQQARLVPYTTFRAVLSGTGSGCCGSTGYGVSGYAPATYSGGSACCGQTPSYASPAVPYYSGPSTGSAAAGTIMSPADTQPRLPLEAAPADGATSENKSLMPIRDPTIGGASTNATGQPAQPKLITPGDRTTRYPILRVGQYRPISWREPTPSSTDEGAESRQATDSVPSPSLPARTAPSKPRPAPAVDDGWRPSNR
jgi:hypothetical protein